MADFENPVWGASDTGLGHVVEAPPPDYPFYPTAHCGEVIVGPLGKKGDFEGEFCKTCENATGTGSAREDRPTTTEAKKDKTNE